MPTRRDLLLRSSTKLRHARVDGYLEADVQKCTRGGGKVLLKLYPYEQRVLHSNVM
jgi:hypothetical protein